MTLASAFRNLLYAPILSMETTNTEPRSLSRCEELWFSNKTIVIRVEETLFRVHVDTLTAQSEVFRDMLALPQPVDAETLEGSPVVRIEGTSAQDMRLFLLCLHSATEYRRALSRPVEFGTLLSMSHKYQVGSFQRDMHAFLAPMFPSTFQGYLDAENEIRQQSAAFDYCSLDFCVALANAFRQSDALVFLPITLYRLCRLNVKDVIKSGLSPVNIEAVTIGRSELAKYTRNNVFLHAFHDSCSACKTDCFYAKLRSGGGQCDRKLFSYAIITFLGEDCWLDPLLSRDHGQWSKLCDSCNSPYHSAYTKGRLAAWEKLPEFFGLPPWSQLHASEMDP